MGATGYTGITNNSANLQTISAPLTLAANQAWSAGTGDLAITGTLNTNGKQLTLGGGNDLTFSGVVSGNGSLLVNNSGGIVSLGGAGTNTYSGGTTLSAGTLAIGKNSALGTGTLNISGNATLQASGGARTLANATTANANFTVGGSNDLTLSGNLNLGAGNRTITVDNTGTTTFGGTVSNSYYATITKAGTGTLVLSGSNTFQGPVAVNEGILRLTNSSALGTSTSGNSVANGAELQLSGGITVASEGFSVKGTGISGNGVIHNVSGANTFTGAVDLTGASTFGADAGSLTFSGAVSNHGYDLDTTGAGDFAFTGYIYNSGGLNIGSTGTTTIGSSVSLAGALTVNSSGNVTLNGTAASTVTLNGTGTTTVGGTINGVATVNSGTLVLSKAGGGALGNDLVINSGTVQLGAANQFAPSKTVSLTSSTAALNLNNYSASLGNLTLSGSTIATGSGSLTITSSGGNLTTNASVTTANITGNLALGAYNTTVNVADGAAATDLAISATIANDASGTRNFTKTGAGKLLVSGTNSYTGTTTVSQGTLAVGSNAPSGANGALGNSTTAVIVNDANTGANNTALTIATSGVTVGRDVSVTNNGTGTVTLGGDTSLTSGTAAFTGNITVAKATTVSASGSSTVTFSGGTISGAGAITKAGTGTVVFSGPNSSTGGVTVNDGILKATGTTSTGPWDALGNYSYVASPTTVLTVNSGGTLEINTSYSYNAGTYNGTTLQYQTLSLNGSGYNGNGALLFTGGNSTWGGNITLAGNTTINNTSANTVFLGNYVAVPTAPPTDVKLNGNNLLFTGTSGAYISSMVGDGAGDTGSVTVSLSNASSEVTFGGVQNFYTGDTTVTNGTLKLAVNNGNHANAAVLGNLFIGDGTGAADTAIVKNYYSDQIADTATVTIRSDGMLDLGSRGKDETVGYLTLIGGHVQLTGTNNGNLYLADNVLVTGGLTSNIDGDALLGGLNLNNISGPARTFTVDSGSTLVVNARVNGGSFVKAGDGTMIMTRDNSSGYSGTTTVADGILSIRNSKALGLNGGGSAASGTTVDAGATLQLDSTLGNLSVGAERLTINGTGHDGTQGALQNLSGTNSWAGSVITGSDAKITADSGTSLTLSGGVTSTAGSGQTQTLTVGGAGNTYITGPVQDNRNFSTAPYADLHTGTLAITKVDSGTLTLSNGGDTFTGAIKVQGGTLAVTANNVLASHVNTVDVLHGATFAVSGGGTNTIAALTGANNSATTLGGVVSIAASTTLVVNNAAADAYSGTLTGSGTLVKQGSGTFTFTSVANTSDFNFAGTVVNNTGTLEFQGGLGTLNQGNSTGNALTIGTLTMNGGTLLLTDAYINVGTLNITANTILDFGTAGSSILNATNIYIAAGAVLTVVNWNSEIDYLFANSDFRVNNSSGQIAIQNQIGTGATYTPENQVWFQGDPLSSDGSHTTWIDNTTNYYSYADHQIRPVPEPSTYGALLLAGCFGLLAWKRFRKPAVA